MPLQIVRSAIIPIGPSIAYIPLSRGLFALISSGDVPLVEGRIWYADSMRDSFFARCKIKISVNNFRHLRMHRLITGAPIKAVVDHINGNTLDNRRENLRLCSGVHNAFNRKKYANNTSGLKGVHYRKSERRWQAYITVRRKRLHLGYFQTAQLAHEAYCAAAIKHHGAFARFD